MSTLNASNLPREIIRQIADLVYVKETNPFRVLRSLQLNQHWRDCSSEAQAFLAERLYNLGTEAQLAHLNVYLDACARTQRSIYRLGIRVFNPSLFKHLRFENTTFTHIEIVLLYESDDVLSLPPGVTIRQSLYVGLEQRDMVTRRQYRFNLDSMTEKTVRILSSISLINVALEVGTPNKKFKSCTDIYVSGDESTVGAVMADLIPRCPALESVQLLNDIDPRPQLGMKKHKLPTLPMLDTLHIKNIVADGRQSRFPLLRSVRFSDASLAITVNDDFLRQLHDVDFVLYHLHLDTTECPYLTDGLVIARMSSLVDLHVRFRIDSSFAKLFNQDYYLDCFPHLLNMHVRETKGIDYASLQRYEDRNERQEVIMEEQLRAAL